MFVQLEDILIQRYTYKWFRYFKQPIFEATPEVPPADLRPVANTSSFIGSFIGSFILITRYMIRSRHLVGYIVRRGNRNSYFTNINRSFCSRESDNEKLKRELSNHVNIEKTEKLIDASKQKPPITKPVDLDDE